MNKIAWLAFFWNAALLLIFSYSVNDVSAMVGGWLGSDFPQNIPVVIGIRIPVVEAVIALAVAIVARIIRLHDVLAKFLGIRNNYMIKNILLPIAAQSKVGITEEKLETSGYEFAGAVFYDHLKEIDPHYIKMFWDRISWYWSSLEGVFFLLVFSLGSALLGEFAPAFGFVLSALVLILVSLLLKKTAEKATKAELGAILADPTRAHSIDAQLSKL